MATRTLTIDIIGDPDSASRAFRKVGQDADRMGRDIDKSGGRIRGFATITSKGMGRVGLAAGGMAAAGAGAAALLAKSFVSGATDISESLSKNQVLFGKHADGIANWSKRTAGSLGISRQAALEATGTFGNLFVALDIGPGKAAGMSKSLTKLAADLASFNNATPEEALEAIRSGLVGETEPLRRFGVNINDAALRTEALRMGLVKTTKEALTPQQKALAVNALLFKQTEKAQGDFARTSGGLANQQRILKARLADAGAELGGKLMPIALKGVKALNSLFNESSRGGRVIRDMGQAIQRAADWIQGAFRTAIQWGQRFARDNREDLQSVVRAFRNLGEFVRNVIENVLIPIVKRILPVMKGMAEGAIQAIRGLVRIVTGIINGDWDRVWEGFKDIPKGAVKAVKASLGGLWRALRDAIKALAPRALALAKDIGKAIVDGIVSGIKEVGKNPIADAITNVIPGAGLIKAAVGDGLGKSIGRAVLPSMGAPGLGGGALMGADPDLGPFAAIGARFGLRVTDGIRPAGTRTSSGGISYHGSGDAIDMAGSPGAMMATFRYLKQNFGGRLAELIYTPGGAGIKNGSPFTYTGSVAADHYDHVHVAYTGPFGDGIGAQGAAAAAYQAGFRGNDLINMVAIAGRESSYDPTAQNLVYPDHSIGLWQINQLAHKGRYGSDTQLKNPLTNAKAAFALFKAGGLQPWDHAGGPLGGTDVSAARRAVAAFFKSGKKSGGALGASGGGGGSAGNARQDFLESQRGGRQAARQAVGAAREAAFEPSVGFGLGLARAGVKQARAEARDDLSGLIEGLQDERRIKYRRLKRVNKLLKGRLSKKRRTMLLEEKAQLVSEIGDLNDTLREYKADAAAGAKTISRADELDAGVDPNAGDVAGGGGGDAGGVGGGDDGTAAALTALTEEIKLARESNERLFKTQGPQLIAAMLATVNGGIGGPVGLGFQTPGYAGALARY